VSRDESAQYYSEQQPAEREILALLGGGDAMKAGRAEFYAWALGNELDNTNRAIIAEYLVHRAVGCVQRWRVAWNAFDLEAPDGTTIEVKAAGLVQSWESAQPCKPDFDISKKKMAWLARENRYIEQNCRNAQVWVFAVHEEHDRDKADPFDTSQWSFYVTTSSWLDQVFGDQRRVRLSVLVHKGLRATAYEELAHTVREVCLRDGMLD
jgi:hypothetical protein